MTNVPAVVTTTACLPVISAFDSGVVNGACGLGVWRSSNKIAALATACIIAAIGRKQ